ncbi:MAG: hypothetical protein RL153_1827, partial [Verrucomicrobiota bacterium]
MPPAGWTPSLHTGASKRMNYPKLASVKSASELRARLVGLGCPLPVADEGPWEALSRPVAATPGLPRPPGNRLAILPMEGWDGTAARTKSSTKPSSSASVNT